MLLTGPEVGVAGYYTFLLNGEEATECPSKNLITDFGWSRLLNLTSADISGASLQVGTSNTPPVVTDSALGGLLATKIGGTNLSTTSGTDTVGVYQGIRYSFAFTQGSVVGNVSEVGFRVAAADASLTSRSLVKDGAGNPATITVTAIDQLTVQYEMRYYLNMTLDVTGSVTVAGVPTTYIIRQAANDKAAGGVTQIEGLFPLRYENGFFGSTFSMGAPGTNPGGTNTDPILINVTAASVNVAAGTATFTLAYSTAQANAPGGLFGMLLSPLDFANASVAGRGKLKVSFSPPIPKDSTKTLAITMTITYVRV